MRANIARAWSSSKLYRVALACAVIYALLRLVMQFLLLTGWLFPEYTDDGILIPPDLGDYLYGATQIQDRENLYIEGPIDRVEFYQYPPTYALVFTLFVPFSPAALVFTHTLLHIVVYVALYGSWNRIFTKYHMPRAAATLAYTLPVWLVFASFWSDLGFLNTYLLMALLGTLALEAVVDEHLGRSILWLCVILQIKPQWAFALLVPLLLGRYRFFFRLAALTGMVTAGVILLTSLLVGLEYGFQQHLAYMRFLWNMRQNFPWRGPEEPYLGYSHSITQIVTYLWGVTADSLRAALVLKLALLIPLGTTALRHLMRPTGRPGRQVPTIALDWAFALYAAAFIWLDMVWEFSLGIAVFTYLLATVEGRWGRLTIGLVFMPYALLDFWRLFSVAVFGFEVVTPGVYILTDPSIYVPMIMIVILCFYGFLVWRLWRAQAVAQIALDRQLPARPGAS
ncbi:MAG: DUF2029 domain-containing protein [Anaerolineae bacterium]|nr:DUF2029 domain-containing protein [Anaerolineae bacterium]